LFLPLLSLGGAHFLNAGTVFGSTSIVETALEIRTELLEVG
jgi:hypothetical protein